MKTAIAWIEYRSENKPSIYTQECATIDESGDGDYETVKEFIQSLKNLAKQGGYTLELENVVIG